jgi:hypothetical protein
MPVSLVKPTVGTVRVTLYGHAKGDVGTVRDLARASFWASPGARLAITSVGAEFGHPTRIGVQYVVQAFA